MSPGMAVAINFFTSQIVVGRAACDARREWKMWFDAVVAYGVGPV